MTLSNFDLSLATYSDTIAAQKALRLAKCYNGALDGKFSFYSRAALRTWQKLQSTGGRMVGFVHRSAILIYTGADGWSHEYKIGPGECDGDGSGGNAEHDPDFQPDTSLHYDGKAINSRVVPGIVATKWERDENAGIVLGCQGTITNIVTGSSTPAVVYDEGGPEDDGEISIFACKQVGVNSNPVSGGTPLPILEYDFIPGKAAFIVGMQFALTALNA